MIQTLGHWCQTPEYFARAGGFILTAPLREKVQFVLNQSSWSIPGSCIITSLKQSENFRIEIGPAFRVDTDQINNTFIYFSKEPGMINKRVTSPRFKNIADASCYICVMVFN